MSAPGQAYAGGNPCLGCGRTDTRPYAEGWRCPDHTPAKRRGHPEPDIARYCIARCYCGTCPGYVRPLEPITPTVIDINAIKSGKRRASTGQYRDAQRQRQEHTA